MALADGRSLRRAAHRGCLEPASGSARPGASCATDAGLGALLLVAVVALAVLAPSARALSPLGAIALIAAYALAQRVQFDVGAGYTVPSQLVFDADAAARAARRSSRCSSRRACSSAACRATCAATSTRRAWPSSSPTPARGRARGRRRRCSRPRRLGLERLAGAAPRRSPPRRLRLRRRRPARLARARRPAAAAAAPVRVGLRRRRRARAGRRRWPASPAERQPLAVALVLPLMGLLALFARERRARIENALALSHAYRGTALLMGDLLEADDAYTGGEHSQGVVALALAVGDALGLDARERRNLEFAALLHDIGKIRVARRDHQQAGQAHRRGVRDRQAPPGRRAGDARARRRRARRGRHHRPPPPRALGRRRLPRRPRRRGDPARRTHHLRLRRLQRDDHQPRLPRGAADRRGGRRARALLGRRSSTRTWSSRCWETVARHPEHRPARALLELARSRTAPRTIRSQPKAAAESGR